MLVDGESGKFCDWISHPLAPLHLQPVFSQAYVEHAINTPTTPSNQHHQRSNLYSCRKLGRYTADHLDHPPPQTSETTQSDGVASSRQTGISGNNDDGMAKPLTSALTCSFSTSMLPWLYRMRTTSRHIKKTRAAFAQLLKPSTPRKRK